MQFRAMSSIAWLCFSSIPLTPIRLYIQLTGESTLGRRSFAGKRALSDGLVDRPRSRLTEVKGEPIRVPDVAARKGGILLDDRATGCQQLAFRRFDVGSKQLEDGRMLLPFFDIQSEGPGLEADHCRVLIGDRQARHPTLKRNQPGRLGRAEDDFAGG